MIFQEVLEDIICGNKNLKILSVDAFSLVIGDKLNDISYMLKLSNNEDKVFIQEIKSGFINNLYSEIKLNVSNLKSFFDKNKVSNNTFRIEELNHMKTLSIIGIFIQNEFDDVTENIRQAINFYVLDESTNKDFFISFKELHKKCLVCPPPGIGPIKETFSIGTFGNVEVFYPKYEVNIENAIYMPISKQYIEIDSYLEEVKLFIKEDKLSAPYPRDILCSMYSNEENPIIRMSYNGSDMYFPSGYVNFLLPKMPDKMKDFNENKPKFFAYNYFTLNEKYDKILYRTPDVKIA